MTTPFDEWLSSQHADLSDEEIRELWRKRGRYPHLDDFDEARADVIGQNGNDGEHYDRVD